MNKTNWEKSMNILLKQVIAVGVITVLNVFTAHAQTTWPDRAIKVVVPYTPGGGTDAVTRNLLDKLTSETKWILIVDNKPGGGGNVGLDIVAKSKPDGYTLGMGQTANLAINPALMQKMPFDPVKDLIPVALIAELPTLLVVRQDSSMKNLSDVIQAAKAKPGNLKQALAGSGTVGHLAGEMLAVKAGISFLNVPYKGAAPAITDLLGGQTDFMFATPQGVLGMIKGGKMRALAVTSTRRLSVLPEVPTVDESGYKGFEAVDWKLLVAPANTPASVIQQINAAVEKALANPAFKAQLNAEGSAPLGGASQKAAEYLRAEQAEWAALIRTANIKLN
jgi:tripartite-type tricarboxylate transporter receptor subunit TctC